MKKCVVFFLVFLYAGLSFAQEPVWFGGPFQDAKAQAQREGKLILIDFFSDT